MLVERGLQVMNVEAVGDAYAIAAELSAQDRRHRDTLATNDRLLEIIVELFHRGEYNRIKLANKAIRDSKPRPDRNTRIIHGRRY